MKIYTRGGDDGTTGLYFGGRVAKTDARIELNGAVDEAQATLGFARSWCERDGAVDRLLVSLERDLWVLMAEVATSEENRRKLVDGVSRVTPAMVQRLEDEIDRLSAETEIPHEFVVPGEDRASSSLDVARTVVRRAERAAVAFEVLAEEGSSVGPYLNRLSDLVWTLARSVEGPHHRTARERD